MGEYEANVNSIRNVENQPGEENKTENLEYQAAIIQPNVQERQHNHSLKFQKSIAPKIEGVPEPAVDKRHKNPKSRIARKSARTFSDFIGMKLKDGALKVLYFLVQVV